MNATTRLNHSRADGEPPACGSPCWPKRGHLEPRERFRIRAVVGECLPLRVGFRVSVRELSLSLLLKALRLGAKVGANVHSHQAMPGDGQPALPQVNATSRHMGHRQATE
jgi:hypothetical protein